jgi:glutaminase
MAGKKAIDYNQNVYYSERETGDRNRSLAYFMRASGIIKGDVGEILDLYFRQCSIEVTCRDLAAIGNCIANDGLRPAGGSLEIEPWIFRLVKTFMIICGMYNASGEFAVRVGVPAKSGVSGGIMACVPGRMGIGVVGPALDSKGNSIAGVRVLEDLSREINLSIF